MNAALGARIRYLRESKGFTQEEVAGGMGCSRQKYARIEKGFADISYANITMIAQILRVKTVDITSSVSNIEQAQPVFRENDLSYQDEKFEFISEMLDVFYAHRKLYHSVRRFDPGE